jgi:hypothetical protein
MRAECQRLTDYKPAERRSHLERPDIRNGINYNLDCLISSTFVLDFLTSLN